MWDLAPSWERKILSGSPTVGSKGGQDLCGVCSGTALPGLGILKDEVK